MKVITHLKEADGSAIVSRLLLLPDDQFPWKAQVDQSESKYKRSSSTKMYPI
jgi:hypothetical protein